MIMKKIAFVLLASATIFLVSCGGNTEATSNETVDSTAVSCDTSCVAKDSTCANTTSVSADTTKK